jgi:DNA repair exonuclease SbcCD ATPase subunit
MSTQPQPDPRSENRPEQLFTAQESAPATKPEVATAVERFWETVRQSAEVIVTLRQENALVNAQNVALRKSESDLNARIDDLLARIATLEEQLAAVPHQPAGLSEEHAALLEEMRKDVDRAEDQLKALNESLDLQTEELHRRALLLEARDAEIRGLKEVLSDLQQRLDEANAHLRDNESIRQQLEEVRADLAARSEALDDLREAFGDATRHRQEREALEARLHELELAAVNDEVTAARIQELTDEAADLRRQLDSALSIVSTYREAGLRHIEEPGMRNQMTLFAGAPAPTPAPSAVMGPDEILALADRLDDLAGRVAKVLGIS